LTYIYGIGNSKSESILTEARVDFNTRTDNLTEDEVARIRSIIETREKVEGDLRREIQMSIKRLMDLGLPRPPSPQGASGPWPTDPHQCADSEGTASRSDHRQEGRDEEVILSRIF